MRVEKPRKVPKARVHKVKQGTPPKLSASQKRKLVRLYLFTSLSWKDISSLIVHFGQKDIKKRALQYTLQNLLSAQYDQMRPKDTFARRERASQLQRFKSSSLAHRDQQKNVEPPPPPQPANTYQRPSIDKYSKGKSAKSARDSNKSFVRNIHRPSLPALQISLPHYQFPEPEFSTRETAFLHSSMCPINGDLTDLEMPISTVSEYKRMLAIPPEAHSPASQRYSQSTPGTLLMPSQPVEDKPRTLLANNSNGTVCNTMVDIAESKLLVDGDAGTFNDFDRLIDMDGNETRISTITYHDISPCSSIDQVAEASPYSQLHLTGDTSSVSAAQFSDSFDPRTNVLDLLDDSFQPDLFSQDNLREGFSLEWEHLAFPNNDDVLPRTNFDMVNTIQPLGSGSDRASAELATRAAVRNDSKVENSDVTMTQDTAGSSIVLQGPRSSELSVMVGRLSNCSSGERSFIKNLLKRLSAATISSSNSSIRSRLSIRSCRAAEGHESSVAAPLASAMTSRDQPNFLEVCIHGGISNTSTFWWHMIYESYDWYAFTSTYREGHRPSITQAEREWYGKGPFDNACWAPGILQEIWTNSGLPCWFDRFGNTSLHIAAMCGATFSWIQDLINEGVSVNALNSAKQTFMHVLDPKSFNDGDMYRLKIELDRRQFHFDHRDVDGELFLDNLNCHISLSRDFHKCWLGSSFPRVSYPSRESLRYCPLEQRFKRRSWDFDLPFHYFQEVSNAASNINRLFHTSKESLQVCKDFEDLAGRGWLHIAADAIKDPPHPNKLQQLSLNSLRLKLVRTLLDIGVNVNCHDRSGETPLMAHLRSKPYQDAIVEELLHHRADPDLRNRAGETALHIAVQLGNVIAIKALLDRGANVHVRNRSCEGLLTVAERAQRRAKDDVSLYAEITACIALAIDAGAIASPNLFHEWDLPLSNNHNSSNVAQSPNRICGGVGNHKL
ncbi:MAG: hypothetical protein Q9209_000555 [Squamulea sp. 1 TL-2023]